MSEFRMPSLGADMEAGTLVEWKISPGDSVERGQVVAVVETDKGAIDVEIFEEGEVAELCVSAGTTVPVGTLLARLQSSEPAADRPAPPDAAPPSAGERKREAPAVARQQDDATPGAVRRAGELGLDLNRVTGTGLDGRITLADVEVLAGLRGDVLRADTTVPVHTPVSATAVSETPAPQAPTVGEATAGMRRAIGAAMARSKREIPHYYLSQTVDVSAALAWLGEWNAARPPDARILPAVLLIKACALALRRVPELNGFWERDGFRAAAAVHLGWAISLRGGGLVAPAIHDADQLALPDLMQRLADMVRRARSGGLRSSELADATVTLTSLGERGAESVHGVIYPPQVALIGLGHIALRPWVVDGAVVPRSLITLSLAADHRASDGQTGGRLLATIDRLLQSPEAL